MKTQFGVMKKYGIWLLDIICVIVSFVLAVDSGFWSYTYDAYIKLLLTIQILSVTIINFLFKSNRNFVSRTIYQETKTTILYNMLLASILALSSYYLRRSILLERKITVYFFIYNSAIMFVSRTILKFIVIHIYRKSPVKNMILIITTPNLKEQTVSNFITGATYKIDGVITLEGHFATGTYHDKQIKCNINQLSSNLVSYQIDDVYINLPNTPYSTVQSLISDFEIMGVTCHLAINAPQYTSFHTKFDTFGDNLTITYSINEFNPIKLLIKRIFDIIISIIGLIITAIISIVLIPVIKHDSHGPAIYTSIRIGQNGRRFKFYKFRSMYTNADEVKKDLSDKNEMNGLMFKMEDDPRITKVGKFIRKTSIDELPQFWNILKGDMSLIGTRPPTEDEFLQYNEYYKRRLTMKPGLTGLWQVSGRNKITDFDDVVKLDLQYIDNWSLEEDLKILLKTFVIVIKKDGAE